MTNQQKWLSFADIRKGVMHLKPHEARSYPSVNAISGVALTLLEAYLNEGGNKRFEVRYHEDVFHDGEGVSRVLTIACMPTKLGF